MANAPPRRTSGGCRQRRMATLLRTMMGSKCSSGRCTPQPPSKVRILKPLSTTQMPGTTSLGVSPSTSLTPSSTTFLCALAPERSLRRGRSAQRIWPRLPGALH